MNLLAALALTFALGQNAIKGLAMAVNEPQDLIALRVETYHNWSESGDVPVVYGVPKACKPVMIVGNEPNAIAPYGMPQTPAQYAGLVAAVRQKCPDAMLVIGNVSVEDWRPIGGQKRGYEWLSDLLPLVKDSNIVIGAHCYSITAWWCVTQLREIKTLAPRGLWITEFGITSGDPRESNLFMRWLDRNTDAMFAYTNRQPSSCGDTKQGWELGGVELINCADGSLTPMGAVFAEWNK